MSSLSGELGVYASFLKDAIYSAGILFLFWVVRWPVYWVFFAHGATWAAFMLYYMSSTDGFWGPTSAAVVTLGVSSLDAFALVNAICYLPGTSCCLPGESASPLTLGQPVCGPSSRYDPPTLVWLAIGTVGLGIFTGVARVVGIVNTREAASLEVVLTALYVGIKLYFLLWWNIVYASAFYAQTALTMALHVAAVLVGFKANLRFVAVLLYLAVLTVDTLVVLGATRSITAFGSLESPQVQQGRRQLRNVWAAPSGGTVPQVVRSMWVVLHVVLMSLTFFNIWGALTRSSELAGPFGAPKQKIDKREPDGNLPTVAAGKPAEMARPAEMVKPAESDAEKAQSLNEEGLPAEPPPFGSIYYAGYTAAQQRRKPGHVGYL